jgi:hypothetical protein
VFVARNSVFGLLFTEVRNGFWRSDCGDCDSPGIVLPTSCGYVKRLTQQGGVDPTRWLRSCRLVLSGSMARSFLDGSLTIFGSLNLSGSLPVNGSLAGIGSLPAGGSLYRFGSLQVHGSTVILHSFCLCICLAFAYTCSETRAASLSSGDSPPNLKTRSGKNLNLPLCKALRQTHGHPPAHSIGGD